MNNEFKNLILIQASRLKYRVSDNAPNSALDLFTAPTLVVWSKDSERTIWEDKRVNWAFRALHDALHIKTGLGFSVPEEIELGRIQANQYSGLLADLIYIEVAGQAEHYMQTGRFIIDQVTFTMEKLKHVHN